MSKRPAKRDQELPIGLTAAAAAGTFLALVVLERRFPLRMNTHQSKGRRDFRNIAIAALAAGALQLTERPVTKRLTLLVRRRRFGLLPHLNLPGWLDTLAGCLLLDVTLYHWHYLTHKISFLWRFHRVHHADLDMDASTGLRFHAGELLLSVVFRAAQVLLFGVSRRALSIWNTLLLLAILFHHSNVFLPEQIEKWVSKLIVTPRLHGVHHSIDTDEVNSNWSSGLTLWDWLHGTYRQSPRQSDDMLELGVPELRQPIQVVLPKLLTMPFDNSLPPPPQN